MPADVKPGTKLITIIKPDKNFARGVIHTGFLWLDDVLLRAVA